MALQESEKNYSWRSTSGAYVRAEALEGPDVEQPRGGLLRPRRLRHRRPVLAGALDIYRGGVGDAPRTTPPSGIGLDRNARDLDEAERLQREALEIRRRLLAASTGRGPGLNNLALLYEAKGHGRA